jgi:hypothetical protein
VLGASMVDEVRDEQGGESACYAHLTCPECGVVLDGSEHDPTCQWEQVDLDIRPSGPTGNSQI